MGGETEREGDMTEGEGGKGGRGGRKRRGRQQERERERGGEME